MTQIKKVKTSEGVQFYPQTHTKAVIDDNGYTAESRLQAMQDEINAKQLEVGAVPSDLTPTEGSTNWVTSCGIYKNTPSNNDSQSSSDLDIVDEKGNVLVRFENGHIKTKNFDSKKYEDVFLNHWKGKKWYGFGTSITNTSNEGKYATYLAQISGMTFVNKGHSGGGITKSSNQSIYNDIMSSDLSDADLITLEVGANDGGAPLGTIYDSLSNEDVSDNTTFCGALNICIRHLQSTTNAQIVVICSPYSRYQYQHPENVYDGNETSASDNHTTLDRNEAIRKVCMINSCYYIPAGCEDGMGYARMNASNDYNVDQIHHTNLGGYNFAQAIWSKIKNIPLFYTSIQ